MIIDAAARMQQSDCMRHRFATRSQRNQEDFAGSATAPGLLSIGMAQAGTDCITMYRLQEFTSIS
jgi:hypothetical protein